MNRPTLIVSLLIVAGTLILMGTTYAYFTATATSNGQVITSGTLELAYETGQDINALNIIPTEEENASIHKYTVKNTGTLDADYNISLIDIHLSKEGTSTFSSNLKWSLYSTSENYSGESLVKSGDFSSLSGYVSGDDTLVIKTNLNLVSGAKQNYILKVWLQEANVPQNEDQNLNLAMKIQVDTLERQEAVSRQSVMTARQSWNSKETFYQYSSSITKIVFQNEMKPIATDISWDISADSNGNCMAYLVPNTEDSGSTYTLYIQGNDVIYLSIGWYLFSGFSNLNIIEGLEYVDTSRVTNMVAMFKDCSSLSNLNLSHFDTSQVIRMNWMFDGCSSLTNLNVSSFDTSKVTTMTGMFKSCQNLMNLELGNFNTAQVTEMAEMFWGSRSLINLDLSNFDTSQVVNMSSMFGSCSKLTNLDFRSATFTTVTTYSSMFESVPSTIQVIVKDSTAQAWIQDKLGSGVGTVTIAPTV